ncbi:VOC family protein [Patulibacter sp. NPDC049589]|uniref:VOC family protein n=1 Tax=Patulibacter sp. NPDC049589 TaxID=3154731 RepID=UPI003422C64D
MSDSHHPAGGLAHFDIAGPDVDRLHGFYRSVFAWEIDVKGPGYALVRTPEGTPDGAIVEADEGSLTVGVVVDDVAAAVAAAEAGGGAVVMPPTDNGWVVKAQVDDPAGNRVTLIQR